MSTNDPQIDIEQFFTNLLAFRYREVMMMVATLAVLAGAIVFFPGVKHITKGIQSNVSLTLFVLFIGVAIVAGAVKGMLGFGYSLIPRPYSSRSLIRRSQWSFSLFHPG